MRLTLKCSIKNSASRSPLLTELRLLSRTGKHSHTEMLTALLLFIKNGVLLHIFIALHFMCRVMKILDFFFNYRVHLRLVVSLL